MVCLPQSLLCVVWRDVPWGKGLWSWRGTEMFTHARTCAEQSTKSAMSRNNASGTSVRQATPLHALSWNLDVQKGNAEVASSEGPVEVAAPSCGTPQATCGQQILVVLSGRKEWDECSGGSHGFA